MERKGWDSNPRGNPTAVIARGVQREMPTTGPDRFPVGLFERTHQGFLRHAKDSHIHPLRQSFRSFRLTSSISRHFFLNSARRLSFASSRCLLKYDPA
jgi:hypothetical protein